MDITFNECQQKAVELMKEWFYSDDEQVFVLSGYAGTGKTFLISNFVNNVLELDSEEDVAFIAPTGKAAVVLMKKGVKATTLHKLIYDAKEVEYETLINGEVITSKKIIFVKKKEIPNYKLIVLDEVSMVSDDIFKDLLSYGIKILACGDRGQLKPVLSTNTLLDDPDYTLTEIVRQQLENPIIKLATMARNGEYIPYGNYGNSVIVYPKESLTKERRKYLLTNSEQVLCGLNRTRISLNREIREYLGIDPDKKLPEDGEKIICCVNNWSHIAGIEKSSGLSINMVNGLAGYCRNATSGAEGVGTIEFRADFLDNYEKYYFDEKLLSEDQYGFEKKQDVFILPDEKYYLKKKIKRSDYESREEYKKAVAEYTKKLKSAISEDSITFFQLAYALSTHKSQGSEWNKVCVIDESKAFGKDSANWLYTAITRAKEKLVIIR